MKLKTQMINYQANSAINCSSVMTMLFLSAVSLTAQANIDTPKDCSNIQNEKVRLQCHNKATLLKNKLVSKQKKKQIDLDKTFKSALSGEPKLVMNEPQQQRSADNDTTDYFLNTQVIRKFNKTGSYKPNKLNPIVKKNKNITKKEEVVKSETKIDEQIVSKEKTTDNLWNNKHTNASVTKSQLSRTYDLDEDSDRGLWKPRIHQPLYLMPLFMHDNPNYSIGTPSQDIVSNTQDDNRSAELKFQFSLKSKVAQDLFDTDADLWLGYTQQSHWQVYNENNSRPFRATDYMPELFLTQPVKADLPFGGKLRMLGAGAMHHSNGEDDPLSRSWNRVYLMGGAEWGNLTVVPRIWKRVKAKGSSKKDDNPDIEDFYGYGDVKVDYQLENGNNISGTFRYNPATNKGATEIAYTRPLENNINLYMNLFHGYGESLIDYNHKDTTLGIGVMLSD
ncbi:MAG: phospholipase A [Moraxellaceae bacterium]|nr:phospholipase A [Moraxellaceae bacterium]